MSHEQQLLVEDAGRLFLSECKEIDAMNGTDGRFHGFNNAFDPYASAHSRYEDRVCEIMGVS